MEEEWLHGIIPDSGISDEDLARIKAEIHEQIGTRKQFTLKRVLKWTQIAAAIALPICMVIMGMMYKENRQYAAIPLTEITTQEGEQVSITLPDKSVVALNSLSSIKYTYDKNHIKNVKDKSTLPYTLSAKSAHSKMIALTFYFE